MANQLRGFPKVSQIKEIKLPSASVPARIAAAIAGVFFIALGLFIAEKLPVPTPVTDVVSPSSLERQPAASGEMPQPELCTVKTVDFSVFRVFGSDRGSDSYNEVQQKTIREACMEAREPGRTTWEVMVPAPGIDTKTTCRCP
jgi:hypothetical protein